MIRNVFVLLFLCLTSLALCADNIDLSRTGEVQDLSISADGGNVNLAWSPVLDATAYKVYSSDIPDGEFTEDLNGVFAGPSWSAPVSAAHRFYYVTAQTGSGPGTMIFVEGGTINPPAGSIFYPNLSVSSFYIGKYEVTNAEWEAVMGTGNSDNYPKAYVSWFSAIEYCNRRSMLEGITPCYSYLTYGSDPDDWPTGWNTNYLNHANLSCDFSASGYRLPSEAEWEYAARGGLHTHDYTYSGSNDLNAVGWYNGNSDNTSHPVGELAANELGTHDMSGNLVEWCWDVYTSYYLVIRGGWYFEAPAGCSVYWLNSKRANTSTNYIGFRVCRSGPPDEFVFVEGGTIDPPIGIFIEGLSVSSFFVSKYELTVAEYVDVMVTDPIKPRQEYDNHPVDSVSWFDALEYCNRRSLQEGLTPCYSYLGHGSDPDDWPSGWNSSNANSANVACDWSAAGYRLPTEAEWEYVAWGGLLANFDLLWVYSGSDVLGEVGWYIDNSGGATHPVGQLATNGLGTFDMSGNVLEWCWDVYSGYDRVLRGGCVYSMADFCTNYHRFSDGPVAGNSGKGFRICRSVM